MERIAFVTGGSRGIGLGIAEELAQLGYNVIINGVRDKSAVVEVLQTLQKYGINVHYVQGDIGNGEDRMRMVRELKNITDHLDILVNNAGIAPPQRLDILETTEENYDKVMRINLKGSFFLTQAIAKWMIESKSNRKSFTPKIINVSSISSTVVSVNRGEYCISKAGMSMMSALFSARLGEFDIPVFEIRPGVIKTDMTAGVTEKYTRLVQEGLTIQPRMGLPKDVGRVVKSIASDDFNYSSGQIFMVDGGLTINRL